MQLWNQTGKWESCSLRPNIETKEISAFTFTINKKTCVAFILIRQRLVAALHIELEREGEAGGDSSLGIFHLFEFFASVGVGGDNEVLKAI